MDRLAWASLAAAALALLGCARLERQPADYQTISADSSHDTPLSREEHAKALKLLDGGAKDNPAMLEKAEQHLQQALVADVTFGPAHNTLGVLYYLRRQFYLAAWEFEYAAKLMPDRAEPFYNLGLVYEHADNLERAIFYYEKCVSLKRNDPRYLGSLAAARLKADEPLEAVRPLLEQLVFLETRPEWVYWARQLINTTPLPMVDAVSAPAPAGPEIVPAPSPASAKDVNIITDQNEPDVPELLPSP